MVGFARLAIVVLLLSGLIYLVIAGYLVRRRKSQLEADGAPDRGADGDWLERELAAYRKSLRPKLALVVIVLPMVYLAVVIYLSGGA